MTRTSASLLPWLLSLACLGSCKVPLHAPLKREPWALSRAGSTGAIARLGLWTDYEVDSTISSANTNPPFEARLNKALMGRFGLALGVEHFLWDDVSVLAGGDLRVFDPQDIGNDAVRFERISEIEWFLALRTILPWRWLKEGRLRSFAEVKLAWLPNLAFDSQMFPNTPDITVGFDFEGSPIWTAGVSTGLLYQLSDHWVAQLSAVWEVPLGSSQDETEISLFGGTADFLTEIEPGGLIVLTGLSYYF